ncbi:hypothetical protein [Alicyclobacillus sp. SO9]|uniref:hypothetical protein n=1 Tax=Alicyclobacillus sp. SO9 TaxID=2665646 RepID=UPI0018E8E992|nr:hypothetical protein [Alicyclobacillus sp. SO9]
MMGLEAHRKSYGSEVIAEELADVIIRILDECAADNLDLSAALLAKMKKNRTRSRRHGNLPY